MHTSFTPIVTFVIDSASMPAYALCLPAVLEGVLSPSFEGPSSLGVFLPTYIISKWLHTLA